jgi:hypothetical protein
MNSHILILAIFLKCKVFFTLFFYKSFADILCMETYLLRQLTCSHFLRYFQQNISFCMFLYWIWYGIMTLSGLVRAVQLCISFSRKRFWLLYVIVGQYKLFIIPVFLFFNGNCTWFYSTWPSGFRILCKANTESFSQELSAGFCRSLCDTKVSRELLWRSGTSN